MCSSDLEFLEHPEWFTGFKDHREVLERWVETHLLDVVNRGKASQAVAAPRSLGPEGARLLARLRADPGVPARCWPTDQIARRLGGGPPRLADLVEALRAAGHGATVSAVMAGQVRSDAPWPALLEIARRLIA